MSNRRTTHMLVGERILTSSFQVGIHLVRLSGFEGRWSVAVDEAASHSSFSTRAEAWEAGVREADRLDRAGPN
jgi:hypothetical protein